MPPTKQNKNVYSGIHLKSFSYNIAGLQNFTNKYMSLNNLDRNNSNYLKQNMLCRSKITKCNAEAIMVKCSHYKETIMLVKLDEINIGEIRGAFNK